MSKLTAKSGKLSAILASMTPANAAKYVPRCKPVENVQRGFERHTMTDHDVIHTPGLQKFRHYLDADYTAQHNRKAGARLRRRVKDWEAGAQGKDRTLSQWGAGGFHCPGSFSK